MTSSIDADSMILERIESSKVSANISGAGTIERSHETKAKGIIYVSNQEDAAKLDILFEAEATMKGFDIYVQLSGADAGKQLHAVFNNLRFASRCVLDKGKVHQYNFEAEESGEEVTEK